MAVNLPPDIKSRADQIIKLEGNGEVGNAKTAARELGSFLAELPVSLKHSTGSGVADSIGGTWFQIDQIVKFLGDKGGNATRQLINNVIDAFHEQVGQLTNPWIRGTHNLRMAEHKKANS